MENLQKIDISFNQIKKLPDARVFESLVSLKVLYLHDNLIAQWEDLSQIRGLPSLIHLTMQRNPVCQIHGYRTQVIS